MAHGSIIARQIHAAGDRVLRDRYCQGCQHHVPVDTFDAPSSRYCKPCVRRRVNANAAIQKRKGK